ncbi:LOW QUALITY PROTEIN: interferon omega-1-like [Felis catus]|uniref:LOW QUALITY PROTEIN: interferon omega-1-like n=1 Tax=Felis catus TaxID=9685 RepID=UPI001D19D328|nr:LOW QUALITY PROTEIN: interferon omega-1-like [Felis catus]
MAFSISLLMVLVLILSHPLTSISCDLPQSFDLGKRESFTALNQVVTISLSRLKYRTDFKFPREQLEGGEFREAQAAAAVLRELLQQTFNLLHTERSSAAWSPAPLHGLRSGLHRQLEALDACWLQATGEGERAPGMHGPALAIKRYFQDIRVYLEDEGYSDCAWEIVRLEIRSRFLFIYKLAFNGFSLVIYYPVLDWIKLKQRENKDFRRHSFSVVQALSSGVLFGLLTDASRTKGVEVWCYTAIYCM